MYYHVFSIKADQERGSIHKKKNLFSETHILEYCPDMKSDLATPISCKQFFGLKFSSK